MGAVSTSDPVDRPPRARLWPGELEPLPPEQRLAQLLAEPPPDEPASALTAYLQGRRLRRGIALGLGLVFVAVATAVSQARQWARHRRYHPYTLPASTAHLPRTDVLVWSSGRARFGLVREDPGIHTIVLPDRSVTLAPGCERAWIDVEVGDDGAVEVWVLKGEVVQTPRVGPLSPPG